MIRPIIAMSIFIGLTSLISTSALAAEANGAIILRLPDGASSRCINSSRDKVWLTMNRVIMNKENYFGSSDKYAGVIVNTTISGTLGSRAQKIMFPRMIEVDIESYAAGRGVSIPVEFGLLEGFPLHEQSLQYTNIDFDFNVVKAKERNAWGHALNALVAVTKRLPLPANPFAEGFRFFAEYANSVVDLSVHEKKPDNIKQGNVRLSFSPNGKCPTQSFESTGTIAIIFGTVGSEADGFIDIGKIDDKRYCFESQLKPAFIIKFGRATLGSTCLPTSVIRNDYYGFFLNAIPEKVAAAPNLREERVSEPHRRTWSPAAAHSAAQYITTGFGAKYPELPEKTEKVLLWNSGMDRTPFGESLVTTNEPSVVWRATAVESSAFDIAEAFRRCDANGVSVDRCLVGAAEAKDE